ncbi:MAG: hypothetical protein ACP5PM_04350 [Acidimicrobiales bacterium]
MAQGSSAMLSAALRQLVDEARERAAAAGSGTPEQDFYAGVVKAAEARLHGAALSGSDDARLDMEPAAFRQGYLETTTMISAVAASAPLRLPLPVFDLHIDDRHTGR